jgi:hypothetical protein
MRIEGTIVVIVPPAKSDGGHQASGSPSLQTRIFTSQKNRSDLKSLLVIRKHFHGIQQERFIEKSSMKLIMNIDNPPYPRNWNDIIHTDA